MTDKLKEIEKSVLTQRASRLAKPLHQEDENLEEIRMLVFSAMGSRFAMSLSAVEAVSKIIDIIPIPHTPAHIPGVIRRRGQTIALVNLRFFFYPQTEGLIDEDFAVSVLVKNKLFAFQVEDVDGVLPLSKSDILPVPDSYDKAIGQYLKGITQDGLAILDLKKIVLTEGFGTSKIEDKQ